MSFVNNKIIIGEEGKMDVTNLLGALPKFYKVCNSHDLRLMACNWLESEGAAMLTSLGDTKRGWSEISKVYAVILWRTAKDYVEYFEHNVFKSSNFFQRVEREHGYFKFVNDKVNHKIRTSKSL